VDYITTTILVSPGPIFAVVVAVDVLFTFSKGSWACCVLLTFLADADCEQTDWLLIFSFSVIVAYGREK
jgi:hypothetical protein